MGWRMSSIAAEKASVPSEPTSSLAGLSRPAAAAAGVSASMLYPPTRRSTFGNRAAISGARSWPSVCSRLISSPMTCWRRRALSGPIGAKAEARAVGQDRVDGCDIVGHQAITDRLPAAGIVGRHAADGAARVRRRIDRKEQAVRFKRRVEMAEHDPRLDQLRAGDRGRSPARCGDISSSRGPRLD